MPPTPTEQQRAWELITAVVANDLIGPPRNANNPEQWERIFNAALAHSVQFTTTVANFPP